MMSVYCTIGYVKSVLMGMSQEKQRTTGGMHWKMSERGELAGVRLLQFKRT